MRIEADIGDGEVQRIGAFLPRAVEGLEFRLPGHREGGIALVAHLGIHRHLAAHGADLLLDGEGRLLHLVFQRQQHRRAHRGVAGEGQFMGGGEDAHAGAVRRVARRQQEDGLGEVELPRDLLHGRIVQPLRIQHHGQRIAAEGAGGEHIERDKAARHGVCDFPVPRPSARHSPRAYAACP